MTSWSRDKLISESIQWQLILWELILWYWVTVLQACCYFINEYKQQQDPNKRLGSFSFGSPVQKRNLVSRRQGRSNQGGTVCERVWTIPWPPKHALWEHPMISWDVVFMYCQPSLLHSLLQRKQGSVHHWWLAVWLDQAIDCFMPHERHTKLQLRERYCTHYDVTRARIWDIARVVASFPGSYAPEWEYVYVGRAWYLYPKEWNRKKAKVARNLLHIPSYWGVNIIHTEHWMHSWLNALKLCFCCKNCGPFLYSLL